VKKFFDKEKIEDFLLVTLGVVIGSILADIIKVLIRELWK